VGTTFRIVGEGAVLAHEAYGDRLEELLAQRVPQFEHLACENTYKED
jgi:hypothetical protein